MTADERTDERAPLLQAHAVCKAYDMPHGVVEVLNGVNLSIHAGERVCIMGASGAGKSTLLHLLGGLEPPDSGRILVEGKLMTDWGESRRSAFRARKMGIVFQSYHLMSDLNVLENTLMPIRAIRGWVAPGKADLDRAKMNLEKVGLGGRLTHRPVELSGGEQQRLAIVRALMNDPDILLADEPTGNLDADTGRKVLDDLFALSAERKRCLIVVSHDPSLAERCDRTILLKKGEAFRDA